MKVFNVETDISIVQHKFNKSYCYDREERNP